MEISQKLMNIQKHIVSTTQKYDKVALVMDNASYHTVMRDDVPKSDWTLSKYSRPPI